jgi:hypothetical protein
MRSYLISPFYDVGIEMLHRLDRQSEDGISFLIFGEADRIFKCIVGRVNICYLFLVYGMSVNTFKNKINKISYKDNEKLLINF